MALKGASKRGLVSFVRDLDDFDSPTDAKIRLRAAAHAIVMKSYSYDIGIRFSEEWINSLGQLNSHRFAEWD